MLEAEGLPVGVVTAINGASRFTVEVLGMAGHAGTVPMHLRQDALVAAAEMVLQVEREARAARDIVATVGRLEVRPGAVNVIPAAVTFTIDTRSPRDAARHDVVAHLRDDLAAVARLRGVKVRDRALLRGAGSHLRHPVDPAARDLGRARRHQAPPPAQRCRP